MLGIEGKSTVIAVATANERLVLRSKNFDDEVEIGSEPKLDVSGEQANEKCNLLKLNICGILGVNWYSPPR